MNPWFRMYAEFATDPKVQMLSETDQRRLVMLFCIRCNGDETLHETCDETISFQLRVSQEEWARSKSLFIDLGFINFDNNLLNWNKRQYRSDSSTERVRAYRGKLKHKKRFKSVSVTPPDTDTDTDTDTDKSKRKKLTPSASPMAERIPNPPDWINPEAWAGFVAMRQRERHPLTPRAAKLVLTELTKLRDVGHEPNDVLDQSTRNGWRDVFAIRGTSMAGPRQTSKTAQAIATLEAMKNATGTMVSSGNLDWSAKAALPGA